MFPNSGLLPILPDLLLRSYVEGKIGEFEFGRSNQLLTSPVVSIPQGDFSFLDLIEYLARSLVDEIFGTSGAIRWEEYLDFLVAHADVWIGRAMHMIAVLSA